jgi:hypothetical protein
MSATRHRGAAADGGHAVHALDAPAGHRGDGRCDDFRARGSRRRWAPACAERARSRWRAVPPAMMPALGVRRGACRRCSSRRPRRRVADRGLRTQSGRPPFDVRLSTDRTWTDLRSSRARTTKLRQSHRFNALPFKACIWRKHGGVRFCSVARHGAWARTMRGWLPRPSHWMRTWWEQIAAHSSGWACVTCVFVESPHAYDSNSSRSSRLRSRIRLLSAVRIASAR